MRGFAEEVGVVPTATPELFQVDGVFTIEGGTGRFKASCPAAQDLAPPNRRYFRAIEDAEGAGFRRSRTPSC